MSNKWRGLHGPITAALAVAEQDRLFDRPPRPVSKELRALFARLEAERKQRQTP